MTPSGREIKDTMEIAELMKPLNTRVGRRVRNDKIIKVTKTQGGRVGMCAEAKSRGNCDHRPKGHGGTFAKKVAPPCGELHDTSEQRPPMTSALPHAASSSSGMNSLQMGLN